MRVFPEVFCSFLLAGFGVGPLAAQQPPPELTLAEVGQAYRQAHGGSATMNGVDSVVITGETTRSGKHAAFSISRKRPDLFRLDMQQGGPSVHYAFDGEEAWTWSSAQDSEATPVDFAEQPLLAREVDFFSPLMLYSEKRQSLSYLGRVETRGENGEPRQALHVRYQNDFGGTEDYYLDPNTYLEFRAVYHPGREDGPVMVTYLSDYRRVESGMSIPYRVHHHIQRDGEEVLVSRSSVESVSINPGLLSLFFRPPASRLPKQLGQAE